MAISPEVMRERVRAVVIVLATPFNKDGGLDKKGLRANVEFLAARCAGKRFMLFPTGSTGEAYALSGAGRLLAIETVVEFVNGRLPVVAGTAAGAERPIELSRAAGSAGADGVQVASPCYHVPSADGLVRHFLRSPSRGWRPS